VRGRDKNNFKKEEAKWENCWFWVFLAGLVTAFTEKENTLARKRDSTSEFVKGVAVAGNT